MSTKRQPLTRAGAEAFVGGADTPGSLRVGPRALVLHCWGRVEMIPDANVRHVWADSVTARRGSHGIPGCREGSGGLLLPGAPRTALIAYAATASASVLSLALVIWPDNGGTMPSERYVFTARVEPVSPPFGGGAGHCPRVHYAYSTNRLSP